MKLRTRLALFSIFLTTIVIGGTSFSTLYFLKSLVLKEIQANQEILVQNLAKVCEESLLISDDILAHNYVTSLQSTIKGLAYAVFVDSNRKIILGENDVFIKALGDKEAILNHKPKEGKQRKNIVLAGMSDVINYSYNVTLDGNTIGTVYLGFYEDKVEENLKKSLNNIARIILFVSAGAMVLGIIISLIFSVQLTRPIHSLARGAQAIGEGNLDIQIDIQRKDEIGLLAVEFNTMAVKLKELDQLKDAFVSSVSHELRSPLTAISGYVELLTMKPIDQLNPEKTKKALNIIQESTTRLTQQNQAGFS